ncbi:hypothetical protein AMC90_CH01102 [Rhizobium phaseoli]|nr:hypothetical protein AMC90_CH01102 [Rhizobium phaseoli]
MVISCSRCPTNLEVADASRSLLRKRPTLRHPQACPGLTRGPMPVSSVAMDSRGPGMTEGGRAIGKRRKAAGSSGQMEGDLILARTFVSPANTR